MDAPADRVADQAVDLERVLWTREQISARVAELGRQIDADFAPSVLEPDRPRGLLLVGILKGSFLFVADLCRAISLPLEIDFMSVSSYRGTKSTGVVKIQKDLDRPIAGMDVLIVEDIVDTGFTLNYLIENLSTRGPSSISVCTLLDKKAARKRPVEVRYAGFTCPDAFVVGYGLDYEGRYRNHPEIGVLAPRVYTR